MSAAGGQGGVTGERVSAETARQLRAEVAQRLRDADALRRELAAQGRDVRDLEAAISDLRRLQGESAYRDAAALARIQQDVVAGMARFEYGLRRALVGDDESRVFLPGSGEVPSQFRAQVEQYFRSLARKPNQ